MIAIWFLRQPLLILVGLIDLSTLNMQSCSSDIAIYFYTFQAGRRQIDLFIFLLTAYIAIEFLVIYLFTITEK